MSWRLATDAGIPKNRAILASCCGYCRCARNLVMVGVADDVQFLCVKGKGCQK